MRIFKYKIRVDQGPIQSLSMPAGAQILSVREDPHGDGYGGLIIHAVVNPETKCTDRTIRIVGTGLPFDDFDATQHHFIGTVVMTSNLVWHVFDVRAEHPDAARRRGSPA